MGPSLTRRTLLKGSAATAGGVLLLGGSSCQLETLVPGPADTTAPTEDVVASACWIGKQDCGILARRIDGRVVKIEGNPSNPRNKGALCPKGVAQITALYDPERVTAPLVRTNAKGASGTWRTASWDEALTIVADKFKAAIAKDKRATGFVPGRTKVDSIYNGAFRAATGIAASYSRRGNDCGGAAQDAVLVSWGSRSIIAPDLERCEYLIGYWNLTQGGGPSLCQITWPREIADARARGMKVVAIDPYARSAAHLADEWVPIRPGTDMAFWLAVIHVLLKDGFVDKEFLKAHTNAPSLVKDDGGILRQGKADLVWDMKTGAAVPYGAGVDAALAGQFEVGGVKVKPALQVLQDHVQQYPPAAAARISGVPAEQIERIARDLGRYAKIGSTTVIDGVTVPHRPVAFGIHGVATKFHSSVQTNRAILMTFMILGALEAAGGPHFWERTLADPTPTIEGWVKAAAKESGDKLDLGGTKWFPMGSAGYHVFPIAFSDPERYKPPVKAEDVTLLVDYLNPVMTARPRAKVIETWKRFGFVAVVTPYMSATTEQVADVVLPCGTLDKWEGPLGARTLFLKADTVRAPIMDALGQSKSEFEIYASLAEKMGKLTGKSGFVDHVNGAIAAKEQYRLPLDRKPTTQEMLDAWSRSKLDLPITELRKRGTVVAKRASVDKLHYRADKTPFMGVRGLLYIEGFRAIAAEMKARGVPESLWGHYAALPTWTEPAMERSPREYDLYLIDFKRIEHKHARTQSDPLLRELWNTNPLVMHARTAAERGLRPGDQVRVESHDPVTNTTQSVETVLETCEGIRPDTVGLTHHVSSPDQPSANALLFYGDGFWDMGAGWFSHVKVKVTKVTRQAMSGSGGRNA